MNKNFVIEYFDVKQKQRRKKKEKRDKIKKHK